MTPESDVDKAVSLLKSGGVIAMPTDTLYALAANARDAAAVQRVYAIKVREQGKPLPLFVGDLAMAEQIGVLNPAARKLAQLFWPGALTIVVDRQPGFESEALAGGDTVALRQPDHDLVLAIVTGLAAPVTATSANRSGGADPVSADEVRRQLADEIDWVLDRGSRPGGVSSTIVDCTGSELKLLRSGAINPEEIESALAARLVRTRT